MGYLLQKSLMQTKIFENLQIIRGKDKYQLIQHKKSKVYEKTYYFFITS